MSRCANRGAAMDVGGWLRKLGLASACDAKEQSDQASHSTSFALTGA
jgi:hypothetical protein